MSATIQASINDLTESVLARLFTTEVGQVTPDPAGYVVNSPEDWVWEFTETEGGTGVYRVHYENGDGAVVAMGWVWVEASDSSTYIVSADENTVQLRKLLKDVPANVSAMLADTNELQTDWADGGRLDTILDSVQGKTDTIGSGTAVVQNPTTEDGYIKTIVLGDDYNEANDRAFVWEFDEIPGFTIGSCQGRFGVQHPEALDQKFLIDAGTSDITDVGGGKWQVKFEVDKSDTQNLIEGAYDYSVEIHQSGEEITIIRNQTPRDRVLLVVKQTHE